ncbi:hypothetical protein QTI33_09450 [Variovorax sp. J22P271]|uniref:hypothetical protein n=1 Tax=Variovorax davisae TaxID=3053515 RepID=UPI0025758D63|nr:hypothetical protein [Variovorax sp. J22P271]MDM0032351.1 hypothetical protein [Variovorax sp. J22P271]
MTSALSERGVKKPHEFLRANRYSDIRQQGDAASLSFSRIISTTPANSSSLM